MKLKTSLFFHQEEAYNKLKTLRVAALYMKMGTGKTRTMLEIIKHKVEQGKVDKILWFCPCSAKMSIKKDLEKHLDSDFHRFSIVGLESVSQSLRLNFYLLDFVKQHRCLIVVDESIKIKNIDAKRTERLIRLGEFTRYRYILNGTSITKNELDLFAQWYFLDWRIFGYKSSYSFARNHIVYDDTIKNKIVGIINTEYLMRKIEPYSYQVSLEEMFDMPDKVYERVYFSMTREQNEMYDEIAEYLLEQLDEFVPSTIYVLFSNLQLITAGFILQRQNDSISKIAFLNDEDTNPRLKCLKETIESMDGKIIIYCKYTAEVDSVCNMLNRIYGEQSAVRFDGMTSQKRRNLNLKTFENSARFLVANKECGSYSLNLQFCHQIIFYNNDFDYGTRGQAEDRIYRIGQSEKCLYVDIVASFSIEEKIMKCLSRKQRLSDLFEKELKSIDTLKEIVFKRKYFKKTINADEIKVEDDLIEPEKIS